MHTVLIGNVLYIPSEKVLIVETTVLLALVPKLAVTLKVQLLPGESEDIV